MATRIIGKGERRVDALGKVTGRAKFAADYNAGHQLYGKVLRSQHPHAGILGIDTAKARQLEGVEAVLTAQDIPGEKVIGIVVKNHLAGLRATHRLADVLREIKSASSRWVHEEIRLPTFAWQEGYGAFTVSASQRETVRGYIAGQEEHHRTRTFKEEYLEFLQKSGVIFDPRYL